MKKDIVFGILLFILISAFGIGVTYLTGDKLKLHQVTCIHGKCTYKVVDLLQHDILFYEAHFHKKDLKKTWFYRHNIRHGYSLQASTNDLTSCKRKCTDTNHYFDCIEKFYKADISPIFFTQKGAKQFYVNLYRRVYYKYDKLDLLLTEGEIFLFFSIALGIALKQYLQKRNEPPKKTEEDDDDDGIKKKKKVKMDFDDGPIKPRPVPPEKRDSTDSISEKLENYRKR